MPRPFSAHAITASALALTLLLAACDQGYPTDDIEHRDPAELTPAQRLDAMNKLGRTVDSARRWQYAVEPDCRLRLSLDVDGEPPQMQTLPLRDNTVDLRQQPDRKHYAVALRPRFGDDANESTLLDNASWADAILMRDLVLAAQRDCAT